jgi:class 3 adenylate cyclase
VAVEPVHRTILAVDIEAFSDPARTNPIRLRLHQHLTRLLTDLLTQAGVTDDQYATSDTGDGLVISVAPHTSAVRLLDPLVPRLARRLAAFNRGKPPPNRMRLRVAVHAGGVLADPQPLHGDAVIHTCRLLDSPVARSCLQATQQPLVVIVSRTVYDEVVRHGYGRIVPAAWQPVTAPDQGDRRAGLDPRARRPRRPHPCQARHAAREPRPSHRAGAQGAAGPADGVHRPPPGARPPP